MQKMSKKVANIFTYVQQPAVKKPIFEKKLRKKQTILGVMLFYVLHINQIYINMYMCLLA